MLPETWTLLQRNPAGEVVVARNTAGRLTIWHLEDRGHGWRIYKVTFSRDNHGCNLHTERMKYYEIPQPSEPCKHFLGGCWDHTLHRNGQRLTDQRFHRILADYCSGVRS